MRASSRKSPGRATARWMRSSARRSTPWMRKSNKKLPCRRRRRNVLPSRFGNGFKTQPALSLKKNLPPYPLMGPVSTIITFTVFQSVRHEEAKSVHQKYFEVELPEEVLARFGWQETEVPRRIREALV